MRKRHSPGLHNLWLQDSVLSLGNLGITSELLDLVNKHNEKARIIVKTPLARRTLSSPLPLSNRAL